MFANRHEAGRLLAVALEHFRERHPIVLALPRGGVDVGVEVARALQAPLDVLVVRKIGAPGNPEFAIGAVGEGDATVIERRTVEALGIEDVSIDDLVRRARDEVGRRVAAYRGGRALTSVTGRTVIVVDDGLATGATARAAGAVLKHLGAALTVLAVPTGSRQGLAALKDAFDAVVCVEQPDAFMSVGEQYAAFPQVSDDAVIAALAEWRVDG